MSSRLRAVILTLIGIVSLFVERDATLLVLIEMFAIPLFFDKESRLIF